VKTDGNDFISGHDTISNVPNTPLTKREYFAGLAMQGYCANSSLATEPDSLLAEYAIKTADALIDELNRENK